MKLLIPFTPHLAYECLELLKCKDSNTWPEVKEDLEEKIKFAIQINGKTRDILSIENNSEKEHIISLVQKNPKTKKIF